MGFWSLPASISNVAYIGNYSSFELITYSLDPPLRKLHVKKTGVGHKPGGLKKKAAPWQAPC